MLTRFFARPSEFTRYRTINYGYSPDGAKHSAEDKETDSELGPLTFLQLQYLPKVTNAEHRTDVKCAKSCGFRAENVAEYLICGL